LEKCLANKELGDLLREECRKRHLSLRRLSINAGLSPGTVHAIVTRHYIPTVYVLNQLADYLRVKRQYLWQVAGLLGDMDYDAQTTFGDPELKFHFARADRLPPEDRRLIITLVQSALTYLEGNKREE
jgi:transcriptional regulator with XRE-family HTH domain